jgi:CRP/FNR family transcriptional regulator, cyclic AMP receptor protein
MASLRETLQTSLWARTLSAEEMAQVCAESYEEYVQAGTHVARIGDAAQHWVGVSEGVLIMTVCSPEGKESTFTGVTNGGWFGEGTLLKEGPWRYNAIAARDSRIVCMPRATFRRLVQTSLPFNHFLLSHLNARLGLFISMVEYDRLLGPDARVARCLASLFNPDIYPQTGRFVKLSQEEIGHLSGLSRQRANQALQLLEKAGLLHIEFGGVSVSDLAGLRSYSGTPGKPSRRISQTPGPRPAC